MINFDYLLLEAFSENLIEEGDNKEKIGNYLKNLKGYKMYLKKKQFNKNKESEE